MRSKAETIEKTISKKDQEVKDSEYLHSVRDFLIRLVLSFGLPATAVVLGGIFGARQALARGSPNERFV